jgi:hypothetical protein
LCLTPLKVVIANRWTSLVDFIAFDLIQLPSSTLHSLGSLHNCIKINRKNKRQSRFAKVFPILFFLSLGVFVRFTVCLFISLLNPLLSQVMVDSLANLQISSVDQHQLHVKNEIMFCDIIAVQVALCLFSNLSTCLLTKIKSGPLRAHKANDHLQQREYVHRAS